MADTVALQVMQAVVAEMKLISDFRGAKHATPWDVFEQNLPFAWVYSQGEKVRPEEEGGNIIAVRIVGIEVVFEVPCHDDIEAEGERILGLVQSQIGAAMTEDDPTKWRSLRRLTTYFDEVGDSAVIQELPNERGAPFAVASTRWAGEYVRSFADPTVEG